MLFLMVIVKDIKRFNLLSDVAVVFLGNLNGYGQEVIGHAFDAVIFVSAVYIEFTSV